MRKSGEFIAVDRYYRWRYPSTKTTKTEIPPGADRRPRGIAEEARRLRTTPPEEGGLKVSHYLRMIARLREAYSAATLGRSARAKLRAASS